MEKVYPCQYKLDGARYWRNIKAPSMEDALATVKAQNPNGSGFAVFNPDHLR